MLQGISNSNGKDYMLQGISDSNRVIVYNLNVEVIVIDLK